MTEGQSRDSNRGGGGGGGGGEDDVSRSTEYAEELEERGGDSNDMAALDRLPQELLEHIFTTVPLEHLLHTVSKVCRRFEMVVSHMLKHRIDLAQCFDSANVTDQVMYSLVQCSRSTLKELRLPRCPYITSAGFSSLRRCRHLRTLVIQNTYVSDTALDAILSLPSLKRLELRDLDSTGLRRNVQPANSTVETFVCVNAWASGIYWTRLEALRSLTISEATRNDMRWINALAEKMGKLEHLCLERTRYLQHNYFLKLKSLRSLQLRQCHFMTPLLHQHNRRRQLLHQLLEPLRQLEELEVTGCENICFLGFDIQQAFGGRSLLKRVTVDGCSQVPDDFLFKLTPAVPDLTHLTLRRLRDVSSDGVMEIVSKTPSLTALELVACPHIDDAAVERIVHARPTLTDIDLSGCTSVSKAAVDAILDRCPSIKRIVLRGCYLAFPTLETRRSAASRGVELVVPTTSVVSAPARHGIEERAREWDAALEQTHTEQMTRSLSVHMDMTLAAMHSERPLFGELSCTCEAVSCLWCGARVRLCQRHDHLQVCSDLPLPCYFGCGAMLPRCRVSQHPSTCSAYVIKCGFNKEHFLSRCNYDHHLEQHLRTGHCARLPDPARPCPLVSEGCTFATHSVAALARHMRRCVHWTVHCQGCGGSVQYSSYHMHVEACAPSNRFHTPMSKGVQARQGEERADPDDREDDDGSRTTSVA